MAGPGGASTRPIDLHGGLDERRVPLPAQPPAKLPQLPHEMLPGEQQHGQALDTAHAGESVNADERRQLDSLMDDLKKAVENSQALAPFKDQLLLDITPEGLRIQIVDQQNRPMFDSGSAHLKPYTATILTELARSLNTVPNRLTLTGPTDAAPYAGASGRTNWDLSSDRANAARRALEAAGLAADKTARVVGLSSSVLSDRADPRNPINRRISIIVMTRQAQRHALKTDTPMSVDTGDTHGPS
jgi:chemotaxis protein MotB